MPWRTRAYGGDGLLWAWTAWLALAAGSAQLGTAQKIKVATGPPEKAETRSYRDGKYGVRFRVPPGWSLTRKDHEVSTFRLDARTATRQSQMRAVAALDFNPFPQSTFSGALFYYSVERHTTDAECASEAKAFAQSRTMDDTAPAVQDGPMQDGQSHDDVEGKDTENIGGMDFAHGHDEHGGICVEGRDEVYTAYRKGSCYRFDLAVNTFCSVSSGARDLTQAQIESIEERMTTILSSVALTWEKSGPHPVPVPEVPMQGQHKAPRSTGTPVSSGG